MPVAERLDDADSLAMLADADGLGDDEALGLGEPAAEVLGDGVPDAETVPVVVRRMVTVPVGDRLVLGVNVGLRLPLTDTVGDDVLVCERVLLVVPDTVLLSDGDTVPLGVPCAGDAEALALVL